MFSRSKVKSEKDVEAISFLKSQSKNEKLAQQKMKYTEYVKCLAKIRSPILIILLLLFIIQLARYYQNVENSSEVLKIQKINKQADNYKESPHPNIIKQYQYTLSQFSNNSKSDTCKKVCKKQLKSEAISEDNLKIFVYNLSDYYVTPQLNHMFNPKICAKKLRSGTQFHPMFYVCNYGYQFAKSYNNISETSQIGGSRVLYDTNVYGLSIMYHYRMMTSRFRTTNPKEANLFYIPYYPNLQVQGYLRGNALLKNVDQQLDSGKLLWDVVTQEFEQQWQRNLGTDHIMMNDVQLEFLNLKSFRKYMYPPIKDQKGSIYKNYYKQVNLMSMEDSFKAADMQVNEDGQIIGSPPQNHLMVPHSSSLHFGFVNYYPELLQEYYDFVQLQFEIAEKKCDCSQINICEVQAQFKQWLKRHRPKVNLQPYNKIVLFEHKRNKLVSYLGGSRKWAWFNYRFTVKQKNYYQCRQDKDCYTLEDYDHPPERVLQPYIIDTYWDSVFCLSPPGDGWSRKGLFDAWALGCIPVINDMRSALWPSYVEMKDLQDYLVFVDGRKIVHKGLKIMDVIREINQTEISRLQQNIQKLQYQIQYSIADNCDEIQNNIVEKDAFEIAISGMGQQALINTQQFQQNQKI